MLNLLHLSTKILFIIQSNTISTYSYNSHSLSYYNYHKNPLQIYCSMRGKRQKQEPFYVKRTRMKDSIIKCKEIIQNYTVLENQLKKSNYKIDVLVDKNESGIKMRAVTTTHNVQECDLLNNRVVNFDVEQMKNMIKVYQERKTKDAEQQMIGNGLIVQKAKNNYGSSRNTRIKTDFSPQKGYSVDLEPIKSKKYKMQTKIENQVCQDKKQLKQTQIQQCLAAKSVKKLKQMQSRLKKNESETLYKQHNNKLIIGKDGLLMLKTRKRTESYYQPEQQAKNNKRREYLYQKMQKPRVESRMRLNPIYQKRIKSYTDFLWKIMLAHNVYVNLDLREPPPFITRLKAYVYYGNNCNMVKGLIKKRFWWSLVEEYSEDCLFVWSQLKFNKIYRKQENYRGNHEPTKFQEISQFVPRNIFSKRKIGKEDKQKLIMESQYHKKIFNFRDLRLLQSKALQIDSNSPSKCSSQLYETRTKQLNQTVKQITMIKSIFPNVSSNESNQSYYKVLPIIHNHLENNFNLGNKKALFHNLKHYYTKIKDDLFQYIPLTFHIRNGVVDPEYKRFVKYYQQRRNLINKMSRESNGQKGRNIWIIKPGENSNRGTGIVVIDQIYELDRILKQPAIKRATLPVKDKGGSKSQGRTYIVQMYIDRPFLYNNRKFDIRHYMLITNLHGVTRAYWYDQGYVRTSSYQFNLQNFDPEIHLTNDAIQQQYFDYGKHQPYNKLSYSELQNYLGTLKEKKYNFKAQILPIMKKIATDAVNSVYTKISPGQQMHNFQIFGLDFMIDREFKPWLIQINTNPCLDCSCPLLDRIIPYMVEQSLKLSLDVIYPPPSHYPNSSKHEAPFISLEGFKYQLIFDSLADGKSLERLFKDDKSIQNQIGIIDDDQVFKDDGKEIKLQDFA